MGPLGNFRYIAVINLLPFQFRNGYVTAVSHLKPPYGGFRNKTAIWIQKWFKKSVVETSRNLYTAQSAVYKLFKAETRGVVISQYKL